MRSGDQPSRYEKDLLHRRARQCLTASTAEQPAADTGYAGHSIFTGHVLEVLRGQVRLDDGLITASNLTAHVKHKVGNAPEFRQTPDGFPLVGHEGGEFVFSAPRVPFTLEESAVLARLLCDELGPRIDEPSPVELGARLWGGIIDARPANQGQEAEALRERGRALLALERFDEALRLLTDPRLHRDPDAVLLRGITYLRAGDFPAALDALRLLVTDHPDHAYAGWARMVVDPRRTQRGKRHALLIGVGKYLKNPLLELRGCENDVQALASTLRGKLDFDEVVTLIDETATAEQIKEALSIFQKSTHPEDSFICYFSGNGMLQPQQTIFASYDVDLDARTFVTEHEIDALMTAIPARDKLLITDACHLAPLQDADPSKYRMLFGSGRDEKTHELFAPEAVPRGAFTYFLQRALAIRGNVSIAQLLEQILTDLRAGPFPQTPGYLGDPSARLVRDYHPALEIIRLAERRSCGPFSVEQVEDLASWLSREDIPAPPLWLGIGRALLAKHRYAGAIRALQRAEMGGAWLPLMRSRVLMDDHAGALEDAKQGAGAERAAGDPEAATCLGQLLGVLERATRAKRHVLIVAIGARTPALWTSDLGALLDTVLRGLAGCGVATDDVKVVREVSRSALVTAFAAFAERVGSEPGLFFFIGPGFEDTEIWLSSADETDSNFSDLPLSTLRELASGCPNLTSAVFITQTRGPRQPATGAPPGAVMSPVLLGLGLATVVVAPPRTRDFSDGGAPPPDVPTLAEVLAEHAHRAFSAEQWIACAGQPAGMTIRGDRTAVLFCDRNARRLALQVLRGIEDAPLRRALELLTKLTDQRALAANAWLHRAVVRAELGLHNESLDDIDTALARRRFEIVRDASPQERPAVVQWPEAHYHRGRILLADGRYTEAETALEVAVEQDGDNARAHYHRARAIRRLIEANLEQRARASARRYIELGAPFGPDDDIHRFVSERGTEPHE